MKLNYVITYDEAVDAGTELIDHWLKCIEDGLFTFSIEDFKQASIENLNNAKTYLINTYRKPLA